MLLHFTLHADVLLGLCFLRRPVVAGLREGQLVEAGLPHRIVEIVPS